MLGGETNEPLAGMCECGSMGRLRNVQTVGTETQGWQNVWGNGKSMVEEESPAESMA